MFKVVQPILGKDDQVREGFIYSRISSTDNLNQLLNGIGTRNEWARSPNDPPALWGLYFSAMGRAKDIKDGDVIPVEGGGVTVKPMMEGTVEDLLTKGRYAIMVHMKVDKENFQYFAGAIGEIEDVGGRQMHKIDIRQNYDEVKGYRCQINTARLPRTVLEELGDDVQILVVDREKPPQGEVGFKPYKDFVHDLETNREIRTEFFDISRL